MSRQAADYLDVITQLPPGSRLVLYDIGWEEYDNLLAQVGDNPHFTISYENGRMEIMSPSAKHEKYKNLVHDFVLILSDELNLEVLSYGSTTLKLKSAGKGAEGDDCFYIQHAVDLGDKDDIDLTRDPPPDLVVEIDLTHESTGKLGIYSVLGVPEIWRFDGNNCQILHLYGQQYSEAQSSLAFPFLEGQHMSEFVASSARSGPRQARRELRDWLKSRP
jgi:Uma2 family endonuclease